MMRLAVVFLAGAVVTMAAPPGAGAQDAGHAMGLPATVAEWAHGARVYEGLGSFHRQVTATPEAQRYFDQGMRFLWAFNHDEATRSFARAADIDPACASCYWGAALTVGPNYNVPAMAAPRAQVAFEALRQARENAAHATAV